MKQGWLRLALALGVVLFGGWQPPWTRYHLVDGALQARRTWICESAPLIVCPTAAYPAAWDVRAALYADVTGDAVPECVLLVWRPWRDWPIMRWREGASPLAQYRDALGASAHIIVILPDGQGSYREVWAGSALPIPFSALAVGDVDGDGRAELVTLETDYATGRNGPASAVSVWAWNGFGFSLESRSATGRFTALHLTPSDARGRSAICARGQPGAQPWPLGLPGP